jgi:hypothetical protein
MQLADGRKLSELRDEPAVFVWGVDSRCGSGEQLDWRSYSNMPRI